MEIIANKNIFLQKTKQVGLKSISPKQDEMDKKKFKQNVFDYCKSNNIQLKKTGSTNRYIVGKKKKVEHFKPRFHKKR